MQAHGSAGKWITWCASAVLLLASCTTPGLLDDGYRSSGPPDPDPPRGSLTGPVSWDHLQRLEDWLAGSGPSRSPDEVPGVELELAQGRLQLARHDAATLPASLLELRLEAARGGFERVLSHPDASALERARAHEGLSAVEELRPGAALAGGLPPIRPRSAWSATPATSARLKPNQRPWSRITVHHSATSATAFGGSSRASQVAATEAIRAIQSAHMKGEGWGDIGYHFLIDPAGRLYQGRSLTWQGAHAGGSNNVGNIGICLLGDFNVEHPDARALSTLEALLDALGSRHHIPRSAVKGHRQYKATECPGDHLMPWVERYARGVRITQERISAPTPRPTQ